MARSLELDLASAEQRQATAHAARLAAEEETKKIGQELNETESRLQKEELAKR